MPMMTAPWHWLSAVFTSRTRPQSWTATYLLIFTMPVSVSTETSAICTPPTPLDPRLHGPGFLPVAWMALTPSFAQACFHERLLDESPFTWMCPSTASSWSGWAPRPGATAAKSCSSASTAPRRVEAETEAWLDVSGGPAPAGVPVLFPFDQLRGFLEFLTIIRRSSPRQVRVLHEELERVHVQLGRKVFEGRHRDQTRLRVVRGAPGARAPGVRGNHRVVLELVRDIENIRLGRSPARPHPSGPPGLRLPRRQRAVFLRCHSYLGKQRRAGAGHQQLGIALEQKLHRLPGGPRELGHLNSPAVGRELASKTSPDVIANHVHVAVRDVDPLAAQRIGELLRHAGDVLSRSPDFQMLVVGPLRHLAVRFEATMGNHRNAVVPFVDDGLGILKGFFRITLPLLARRLGAVAGLAQVLLEDKVRQPLVLNFDLADGVLGDLLADRGHGDHLVAFPLDFRAGALNHVDGLHTGELFRFARVGRGDLGVGVRAAEDFSEEHSGRVGVVGVLGLPAGLRRPVNTRYPFPNQATLACVRPIIFTFRHEPPLPSASSPRRARLLSLPCRSRSDTGCRPAPSSRHRSWGSGARRGTPCRPRRTPACRTRTAARRDRRRRP